MGSIAIIAGKEFRVDFRNRWTIAVAVLFAVLALSISYFGGAAAGKVGFTSFDATLASLTTLASFGLPPTGLLSPYGILVAQHRPLLLLPVYPITRLESVTGSCPGPGSGPTPDVPARAALAGPCGAGTGGVRRPVAGQPRGSLADGQRLGVSVAIEAALTVDFQLSSVAC